MCGCLLCTPYWGPGLQPRHVPWLGIEPATLWFSRPSLNPLSHTSQGPIDFLSHQFLMSLLLVVTCFSGGMYQAWSLVSAMDFVWWWCVSVGSLIITNVPSWWGAFVDGEGNVCVCAGSGGLIWELWTFHLIFLRIYNGSKKKSLLKIRGGTGPEWISRVSGPFRCNEGS